jgi:transposase-like protein
MLRLRSPDFHHGRHGDAPHKASVDGMVLGRAFDVDTFKRHVGAATGRSTRPHLQDGLAAGAEAAAIDGRPGPRTSRRGVEVDQAEIPFREGDAFFEPGNAGKILVIGAVEVIDRDTNQGKPRRKHAQYLDTRSGRIRLAMIADNSAASLEGFVRANVKPGATLLTDGHSSYPGLTDYRHDPRVIGKMAGHVVLPWIHRVFSLMKRWGLGTYHGLRRKHVDTYLNEFVFRYNRRFYRHASFETVLGLTARHAPSSYWDIVGRPNPRKGEATPRRAPRHRKTAVGMRRDGTGDAQTEGQNHDPTTGPPLNMDEPGTTQ